MPATLQDGATNFTNFPQAIRDQRPPLHYSTIPSSPITRYITCCVRDTAHQRDLCEPAGRKHLRGAAVHFCSPHGLQLALLLLRPRPPLPRGKKKIPGGGPGRSKP